MVDHPYYTFIQTIRTILVKYAVGIPISLHVPTEFNYMCWKLISGNPSLPTEFIRANMDKAWDFDLLSTSKNVPIELIDAFPQYHWSISRNPNITWDYIKADTDTVWNMERLSKNPAITIDTVLENPDYEWDMDSLSQNPSIDMSVIRQNPDLGWNKYVFAKENPNATWEDVKMENFIRSSEFGAYKYVTPEIVRANPHYGWSLHYLVINPNFDIATLFEMWPDTMEMQMQRYIVDYQMNPAIKIADILRYGKFFKNLHIASVHVNWRDICDTVTLIDWSWYHVLKNPTIFDCDVEIKTGKAVHAMLHGWREHTVDPKRSMDRVKG